MDQYPTNLLKRRAIPGSFRSRAVESALKNRKRIAHSGLWLTLAAPAKLAARTAPKKPDLPYHSGPNDAITDVPGILVGNYTVTKRTHRGTTVILPSDSAGGICAMSVRGSNPVTIGESTFAPVNIGEECDAIVVTGGSFFGLAAVPGVVNFLDEHGRGVHTRAGIVPIVAAAVIYDLPVGDASVHPQASWGYEAAKAAKAGPVPEGNVGAGAGATVGKSPGGIRLKGGLGTASAVLPEGAAVGVLVVVNALGDVVNPMTGKFYAAAGGYDRVLFRNEYVPPEPGRGLKQAARAVENTTLIVIATNALLTKTQLTKVAELAHDGLARAVRPSHTMLDGDTAIAISVGWSKRIKLHASYPGEEVDRVGGAVGDLVVRAILKAIESAHSVPGWPSYRAWLRAHPQRP
jgi:L-aminopeptidase/D-esterase-like protein